VDLQILWYCLIAALWCGYFLLEGFDFGVGMLLPVLGRDESERDLMIETIGPVWDGNEVWLIIAGGATFAAFPQWYATMFSGFYLPLLLILVLLITRAVSFEWRSKAASPRWRSTWTWLNTIASYGVPLIWGIALSNLLRGVPIDSSATFTGSALDLFSVYTVVAGIAMVLLCALHGAVFLTLRTTGDLRSRAGATAVRLAPPAALVAVVFLIWTLVVASDNNSKDVLPGIVPAAAAIVAAAAAVLLVRRRRELQAFLATGGAIVLALVTLFVSLYPRVMVSSSSFADSLTVQNASSAHYSLTVMTVVAVILTPIILLYEAWTYHVFRARLGREQFVANPLDLLGHPAGPDAGVDDS
jgi:cytochrome d ubiquinol oxidase subunit II